MRVYDISSHNHRCSLTPPDVFFVFGGGLSHYDSAVSCASTHLMIALEGENERLKLLVNALIPFVCARDRERHNESAQLEVQVPARTHVHKHANTCKFKHRPQGDEREKALHKIGC